MQPSQREKILGRLILLLSLFAILAVFTLEPIAQDLNYHDFADKKSHIGIPNFLDLLSNLPFIIMGLLGLYHLYRQHYTLIASHRLTYGIFFLAIALVGFGSAYYHFWPNNTTLFWDRLPMTLAFMALFTLIIAEFLSETLASKLFYPLLFLGVFSVIYWAWSESQNSGDLRPYILVQFLPMMIIPLILLWSRSRFDQVGAYWYLMLAYLLSKFLEYFDKEIYMFTGSISGHTLKHLAAAAGVYLLLRSFAKRKRLISQTQSAE